MGNRLKMEKREVLIRLFVRGWSNRKIHNAIGIHRDTIARYRSEWQQKQRPPDNDKTPEKITNPCDPGDGFTVESGPPKCPPMGVAHFEVTPDPDHDGALHSKSLVSRYRDTIRKKLEKGQSARSIYQDLYAEEEYRGSYQSVKRFVRRLKSAKPKLYARIEHPPGLEAQVDFGQGAPTLKNGRYRRPWLFVMTLSNSRKSYEEVVWRQDVETFIRCHERAFRAFGGVTETVLLDNLKSGVLQAHLYEPDLNPNYQAYAQHAGFVPLPCRVGTPEHKGKVESSVKYAQNALAGKRFESLAAQNAYLQGWNRRWASTRIHGTTKTQVNKMYEAEKPHLKPLPEKEYAFFKIGTRKVNSLDSHVEVGGAYYPVPPRYLGRTVDVHFNSQWVKVFRNGELIQWLSAVEKGRFHPDKRCLPENKAYDRQRWREQLLSKCTLIGASVREWADKGVLHRDLTAWRSIQGVVNLRRKYQQHLINRACALAITREAYSYKQVVHYIEELIMASEVQPMLKLIQEDEVIRSPADYARLVAGGGA